MSSLLLFSTFEVSRQAFFRTATTAAIVNLKPIVPGHVLVIPTRVVPRISELSPEEASSLFLSVQTVGRIVEKAYNADALTIACQDGKAAGQSVPHVHFHILPRKLKGDHFVNNDDVYPELESHAQELQQAFRINAKSESENSAPKTFAENLKVDNEDRKPRSVEEMEREASWLKGFMEG